MAVDVGVATPAGGLAAGVAALALWASPLPVRGLDVLVTLLFVFGLAVAVLGYARGRDLRTRRLAVLALGCNAFGLVTLAILYTAG